MVQLTTERGRSLCTRLGTHSNSGAVTLKAGWGAIALLVTGWHYRASTENRRKPGFQWRKCQRAPSEKTRATVQMEVVA